MPYNTDNSAGPFETAGRKLNEVSRKLDEKFGGALSNMDAELQKVIDYLNREVVPQVRQNSAHGLKIAAEQLNRLAEQLSRKPGSR